MFPVSSRFPHLWSTGVIYSSPGGLVKQSLLYVSSGFRYAWPTFEERRRSMEVSTPKEFLDKVLPESFDPEKAADLSAVVQFKISGENGGEWVLTIKDQKLEVTDGTVDSPNMTLIMKDKDYVNLVNGKLSGQKAFMTGKLKFKGDMNLGMKLQALGLI
jgi:putative sterol carrier protein